MSPNRANSGVYLAATYIVAACLFLLVCDRVPMYVGPLALIFMYLMRVADR